MMFHDAIKAMFHKAIQEVLRNPFFGTKWGTKSERIGARNESGTNRYYVGDFVPSEIRSTAISFQAVDNPPDWQQLTPRERTLWHQANRTNKTGFLGVRKQGKRFSASIRNHTTGRKVYIGAAATAEEAARLYDRKALALYGEEAVLNFPEATL